jgi:hypothetical protein
MAEATSPSLKRRWILRFSVMAALFCPIGANAERPAVDAFDPSEALKYTTALKRAGNPTETEYLRALVDKALDDARPWVDSQTFRTTDTKFFLDDAVPMLRTQSLLERLANRALKEDDMSCDLWQVIVETINSQSLLARIALRDRVGACMFPYVNFVALKKLTDKSLYVDFIVRNFKTNTQEEAVFWAADNISDQQSLLSLVSRLRKEHDPRALLLSALAKLRIDFNRQYSADVPTAPAIHVSNRVWYQSYSPSAPVYTTSTTIEVISPTHERFNKTFDPEIPRKISINTYWLSPDINVPALLREISEWLGQLRRC